MEVFGIRDRVNHSVQHPDKRKVNGRTAQHTPVPSCAEKHWTLIVHNTPLSKATNLLPQ